MKTNFSALFFLKKPKNYTKGAVYFIFLRITVDGIRAEMSTSRNCEPERWNAKAGKVIGTKEDVKILNAYLENMKAEVYAAGLINCLISVSISFFNCFKSSLVMISTCIIIPSLN